MQFPELIGYNNLHYDLEWMIAAIKNWVIPYPGMVTKIGKGFY